MFEHAAHPHKQPWPCGSARDPPTGGPPYCRCSSSWTRRARTRWTGCTATGSSGRTFPRVGLLESVDAAAVATHVGDRPAAWPGPHPAMLLTRRLRAVHLGHVAAQWAEVLPRQVEGKGRDENEDGEQDVRQGRVVVIAVLHQVGKETEPEEEFESHRDPEGDPQRQSAHRAPEHRRTPQQPD